MKPYLPACLTALALFGCSDERPEAPKPATETSTASPYVGVWQHDDQLLVLEENGDLYLPTDSSRQGIHWQQQDDQLQLRYLDTGNLSVDQAELNSHSDNDQLSLTTIAQTDSGEAEQPQDSQPGRFNGDYQRNNQAVGHVSGTISVPDEEPLPEHAVLTVSLLNGEQEVARRLVRLDHDGPHFAFRLYYPAERIEKDQDYQLSSQILADGGLFYQSDRIPLKHAGQSQFKDAELALNAVMGRSDSFLGTLAYSDAGLRYTLCDSDRRLPLAGPQGGTLLDDFHKAQSYPLQAKVIAINGVIRKQPGDQPDSTEDTLLVESFQLEERPCGQPQASLTNTNWRLAYLGQEEIVSEADQQAMRLTLAEDGSLQGHGGCNRLRGSYQQDGDNLTFGPLAMTKMACPALATETAFVQALDAARHSKLEGQTLTLFDDSNQPVASFIATYLY